MARGKKTGGRVKGVPNKASAARQAEIAASGLTPLDYMLSVLRDPTASPDRRAWAAQSAAPYVHPRLSSVEAKHDVSDALGELLKVIDGCTRGLPDGAVAVH